MMSTNKFVWWKERLLKNNEFGIAKRMYAEPSFEPDLISQTQFRQPKFRRMQGIYFFPLQIDRRSLMCEYFQIVSHILEFLWYLIPTFFPRLSPYLCSKVSLLMLSKCCHSIRISHFTIEQLINTQTHLFSLQFRR